MPPAVRITVTRRLPKAVEDDLAIRLGARLNPDDHQFTAEELTRAIVQSDIVLCTLTDRLTTRVFEAARPGRTRLLANFGVGFEHIDLHAARQAGIVVTNTPGVLTDDTADLAILLMLAVARRTGEGERALRAGTWSGWRPTYLLGSRVSGKVLGIVGLGRIGQAVARRAHHGLGMDVHYFSPHGAPETLSASVPLVREPTLASLLASADFVSLHCPATPETRHLMDAAALAQMRPGAFLVNTSRGEIVDEHALAAAIADGHLGGAGLDVYENEPLVSPALSDLPNVVLLPHLGSATIESRVAMGMRAVANIDAYLAGHEPPDRVV
jgi:lactate dehydrogenase-like 2-hydroxyacid dehydrogenase